MNVMGLRPSTFADSVLLHPVVSLPELTQTASYHVFSGSEPTFLVVADIEEPGNLSLQIRLFQESGSLLRPIGETRPLNQILSREKGVSQLLRIPIQIPEVQNITSFVFVLQTLDSKTGKMTTLRPPVRMKAYPSKNSYFTRIESIMKSVLKQTGSESVQIFGPSDGPLVSLLKSCNISTYDLGERSPDRWAPGFVYFGEIPEMEENPSLPPLTKGLLAVVLDTDPDTGSRFLQIVNGKSLFRFQVSDDPDFFTEDPEFLHLFTRDLQRLITPTE